MNEKLTAPIAEKLLANLQLNGTESSWLIQRFPEEPEYNYDFYPARFGDIGGLQHDAIAHTSDGFLYIITGLSKDELLEFKEAYYASDSKLDFMNLFIQARIEMEPRYDQDPKNKKLTMTSAQLASYLEKNEILVISGLKTFLMGHVQYYRHRELCELIGAVDYRFLARLDSYAPILVTDDNGTLEDVLMPIPGVEKYCLDKVAAEKMFYCQF